jgi:hypothetical protein
MPGDTQQNRPRAIKTPLRDDVRLPVQRHGQKGLSRRFRPELTTICEKTQPVAIDNLLVQSASIQSHGDRRGEERRGEFLLGPRGSGL